MCQFDIDWQDRWWTICFFKKSSMTQKSKKMSIANIICSWTIYTVLNFIGFACILFCWFFWIMWITSMLYRTVYHRRFAVNSENLTTEKYQWQSFNQLKSGFRLKLKYDGIIWNIVCHSAQYGIKAEEKGEKLQFRIEPF